VRGRARSAGLGLGCALLATACQWLAPEQPPGAAPAPVPAPPAATLCERPAQPAATQHDAKMEASFRAFAVAHLAKLRKVGAARSAPGGHRRVLDEFETELRPTGNAAAPWLGILRYCEQALHCTAAAATSCQPSRSTVVREIFRFSGGKWSY